MAADNESTVVTRNNNKIRNAEAVSETVNHSGSTDHLQYVVVICQ